jgi:hypothetical protein
MASQSFYLLGEDAKQAVTIDISDASDVDTLKQLLAAEFHIVEPKGTWFTYSKSLI